MKLSTEIKIILALIFFLTLEGNIISYANKDVNDDINNIQYEFSAVVGDDMLKENDEVKEGEIIEYSVKIINKGQDKIDNLDIKVKIPESCEIIKINSNYLKDKGELKINPQTGTVENTEFETNTADINSRQNYYETVNSKEISKTSISINAGETINNSFLVRVKNNIQNDTTQMAILEIKQNEKKVEKTFSHKFNKADLKIELFPVNRIGTGEIASGMGYTNEFVITNLSNKDKNNLQIKIIKSNEIKIGRIGYSVGDKFVNISEEVDSLNIDFIPANAKITGEIDFISDYTETTSKMCLYLKNEDRIYKSNKLVEIPVGVKIEAYLQVMKENKDEIITPGERLKYTIQLKNIGKIPANNLKIEDYFSDYIQIEDVFIDGNKCEYELDEGQENIINVETQLKSSEEKNIEIVAKVFEDLPTTESFEIRNRALVYNTNLVAQTEEIVPYVNIVKKENNGEIKKQDTQNEKNNMNNKTIYIVLGILGIVVIFIIGAIIIIRKRGGI